MRRSTSLSGDRQGSTRRSPAGARGYCVLECTLSMENSAFLPWHVAQASPKGLVFVIACDAVGLSSWQPEQAAVIGGVLAWNAAGLATFATAPTWSGFCEPPVWQVPQSRRSPGNRTSW